MLKINGSDLFGENGGEIETVFKLKSKPSGSLSVLDALVLHSHIP